MNGKFKPAYEIKIGDIIELDKENKCEIISIIKKKRHSREDGYPYEFTGINKEGKKYYNTYFSGGINSEYIMTYQKTIINNNEKYSSIIDSLRPLMDELKTHICIWDDGNIEQPIPSEIWKYTLTNFYPGTIFWDFGNGKWEIGQ